MSIWNFTHFDLTFHTVTSDRAKLAMLLPHLVQSHREVTDPDQKAAVQQAHDAIYASVSEDAMLTGAPVSVAYPAGAASVLCQAVAFVDRLLVITHEEIERAIAKRGED